MARYTGAVCRYCRREGAKLFLKGDRCYTNKCAFARRPTPPGQHGQGRRKLSEFGIQLREKQKVKRAYGMMEKQFRATFEDARKRDAATGPEMLSLLERRLDNVVFRLGIGDSRSQARQMVLHGHITVDGKKVDIPSYRVDVGQEIAVKATSASKDRFKQIVEAGEKTLPKWLTFDLPNLKGTIEALPERDDIDLTIEERLIVERYSK